MIAKITITQIKVSRLDEKEPQNRIKHPAKPKMQISALQGSFHTRPSYSSANFFLYTQLEITVINIHATPQAVAAFASIVYAFPSYGTIPMSSKRIPITNPTVRPICGTFRLFVLAKHFGTIP